MVAAKERTDNRLSPQMPWPLVQPDPILVPNPTSKPAMIRLDFEATISGTGKGAKKE